MVSAVHATGAMPAVPGAPVSALVGVAGDLIRRRLPQERPPAVARVLIFSTRLADAPFETVDGFWP